MSFPTNTGWRRVIAINGDGRANEARSAGKWVAAGGYWCPKKKKYRNGLIRMIVPT